MIRSALRGALSFCALAALTTGISLATTLPSGNISADCTGYTVTFNAQGFVDPGDSINVTFQVVMFQGTDTRIETHAETITGTGDFPVSFHYDWAPPACNMWTFLEGGADGSRYDWVNNYGGSGAEALFVTAPATKAIDCLCSQPPVVEICRSPGFWGTHAGIEKPGSFDITGAVLAASADSSIFVCGKFLDSTAVGLMTSAEEALCVKTKRDKKVQLARQLTATVLNCVMSGAGDDCAGMSVETTFRSCNDICGGTAGDIDRCISALECFNDGGTMLDNGMCQMGNCSDDGDPCSEDRDCRTGRGRHRCDDDDTAPTCVRTPNTCHDQPLINVGLGLSFDPPGPAGSSRACEDARHNDCTIFSCAADTSGGSCSGQDGHHGHDGHKHGLSNH